MRLIARLLPRTLLLLALVLLGTVPDGTMRQAGPDGIRLVLCTSDGTKEVWLTEDGDTVPVDEAEGKGGKHDRHCVQVALIAQNAPVPQPVPVELALLFADLARPDHQTLHRQIAGGARRARAPPVSV